ncbi:MAG: hypothetical protein HYT83_03870 [Candidatus Levybacteria bacterium]|nr:hypothetical protein [Candidatus Levybacteria bacterium]
MNKGGILGDALGQLGNIAKQAGKTLIDESGKLAKTTARQVIPKTTPEAAEKEKAEKTAEIPQVQTAENLRQQQNKDIIKAMYAPSEKNKTQNTQAEQAAQNAAQNNPEKTPEEIQKMVALQKQLHKESYYDPLFNAPKQKEEKPVEKIEREKKEEEFELQEKEKKKPKPITVDRAQNVEKFRGASG